MPHIRGRFFTDDGLELFFQAWKPTEQTGAIIAVVHGYCEHSGRYRHLAHFLMSKGVSVYACDLRGHGRSPGQRGHIERFTDYLLDADAFIKWVRLAEAGRKPFLLGHSLGGLISTRYAEQRSDELSGLILSSPFFRLKMHVPVWKRILGITLSSIRPGLRLNSDIRTDLISHDPMVAIRCEKDPLNHHLTSPRWFTEVMAAQKRVIDCVSNIQAPVLLQYAGSDGIADPEAAAGFFKRLAVVDKTERRYAGYYHEIFNEVGNMVVFQDLEAWLSRHNTQPESCSAGTSASDLSLPCM